MPFHPRTALLSLLLATSASASAAPFGLDALPAEQCDAEDENNCVASDEKDSKWVLVFEQQSDSVEYESRAVISIDGAQVTLRRTGEQLTEGKLSKKKPSLGERHRYFFASQDGKLKAEMDATVTSTSCEVTTESCCGDDFKGKLLVERGKQRIVVPIRYYRGG